MQGNSSDNRSSIDGAESIHTNEDEYQIIRDIFWMPSNQHVMRFIKSLDSQIVGVEAVQHYFFRDPSARFNMFYNRNKHIQLRYSSECSEQEHDENIHYDLDSEIKLIERGGSVCYHNALKFLNCESNANPQPYQRFCSGGGAGRPRQFEIKVSCSSMFFTTNTIVTQPQLQRDGESFPFVYSKLQREDTSFDQFNSNLQNIDSTVNSDLQDGRDCDNAYVRLCYSELYLRFLALRDKIYWHHWLHLCGLILTCLLCMCVRIMIASNKMSGWNNAPKFGDYEAQRHWMEITHNLPLSQWYVHGPDNDLQYWGLDYPPLSAYWAWICAQVVMFIDPTLVTLHESRGHMGETGKFFMRCSVIFVDFVILFPPLGGIINVLYKRYRQSSKVLVWYFCTCTPVLLLIDHGHFQYNSFAVGLTMYAVMFIANSRWLLGCVFFTCSMLFKQTAMYYAPAFFGVLLGLALRLRSTRAKQPDPKDIPTVKNTKTLVVLNNDDSNPAAVISPVKHRAEAKQAWTSYVSDHQAAVDDRIIPSRVCMQYTAFFGLTVLATVFLAFLPFILSPTGMLPVIERMFPFKRGIFEDKVANFWCVSSLVIKWKSIFTDGQMAVFALVLTVLGCVPATVDLVLRPTTRRFIYTLSIVSLSFFFFSFQVHEKSIIYPICVLNLLLQFHPRLILLVNSLALQSCYFLFKRDGLEGVYMLLFFILLTMMHIIAFKYNIVSPLFSHNPLKGIQAVHPRQDLSHRKRVLITLSQLLLHCIPWILPRSERFPHIAETIFVSYSFMWLFVLYIFLNYYQIYL